MPTVVTFGKDTDGSLWQFINADAPMYIASEALRVTRLVQSRKQSFQIDLTLGKYADFKLVKLINSEGTVCESIGKLTVSMPTQLTKAQALMLSQAGKLAVCNAEHHAKA